MVRQRRREREGERREEDGEEEEKKKTEEAPPKRKVSRRNMQSLVIGLIGGALTLGAYSQTLVSEGKCIGAGLIVLFFGLLISEGFITL